ncbi:uncharacterized protein LOC132736970 isoform X2 [Ruditapes philippinarum]|uniref:uncharacterized protein LOC132736970 isoform X2 n=1 Tax=Ruditapes philippinarum TaxID=129788 RepID=UPI00295AC991|nr:uncharacterized protein LOC132736970 isoform X2 [Ruditapes philippinarum]
MALVNFSNFLCFILCVMVSTKGTLCHLDFNDGMILKLIDKVESMQEKINKLEKDNRDLKQSISVLIGTTARFRLHIDDLTNRVSKCEGKEPETHSSIVQLSNNVPKIPSDDRSESNIQQNCQDNDRDSEHTNSKQNVHRKNRRQTSDNIAFTAYLDHVIRNLGKDQPVVYNQILLNDGQAYSDKTGIFRVPVSGVYLLSWSVTARKLPGEHAYDVWVKLVVNGVHQTGAVAESRDDWDDNQGSNSVVLRLNQGDEVWTSHYFSYPDVFGDDTERTASFMGVLLYVDQ